MRCDQCNKKSDNEPIQLKLPDSDYFINLCSLSCLTEKAWALRESEPKLSKSKDQQP